MLLDSLFQEIDPRTGELVFLWRASEHYGIEDSVLITSRARQRVTFSTVTTLTVLPR